MSFLKTKQPYSSVISFFIVTLLFCLFFWRVETPATEAEVSANTNFYHIKTWFFITGLGDCITDEKVDWLATKFDAAFGNLGSLTLWKQINSNVKLGFFRPLGYYWLGESAKVIEWAQANGKIGENAFLHYKVNNAYGLGFNDTEDDGRCGGTPNDWINDEIADKDGNCSGQPSDPTRTAPTGVEARAVRWDAVTIDAPVPNFSNNLWLEWATEKLTNCNNWYPPGSCYVDFIVLDDGIISPAIIGGIDKTFEYWGISATDPNHSLYEDRFKISRQLTSLVAANIGNPVFAMPNVGATFPSNTEPYKTLLNQYFNDAEIEIWLRADDPAGPDYERNYDYDMKQVIAATKGTEERRFIQTPATKTLATDRYKLFYLASFYLIKNPNLFYSFQIEASDDYPNSQRCLDHPSSFLWFGAEDYNIGQPKVNSFNKPDYTGAADSIEHFEFASGQDPSNAANAYHVLAREYDNVLVLVKMKPKMTSLTEDTTMTAHDLSGTYRPLNADGTLGAPVTSITLRNGEGAILLEQDTTAPAAVNDLTPQ